jgi:hypothetical protein
MYEKITALFPLNKAIAFTAVEPLDDASFTIFHSCSSFKE